MACKFASKWGLNVGKLLDRFRAQREQLLQPLLARVQPLIQPLQERFLGLQAREQRIVLGGAAVLFLLLLFVVWDQSRLNQQKAANALAEERAFAQRLELIASLASNGNGAAALNGSLLSVVDQASRNGTLNTPPKQIQPDGDSRVRIWFEDVPFDALLRWLAQLGQQGVQVQEVDLEGRPTPGTVSIRLTLGS
jgi:general secretion pathway protein M